MAGIVKLLAVLVILFVFPYLLIQLVLAFLPFILLMVLGVWLLSKVGMGGLLTGMLLGRGRGNAREERQSTLVFRVDGAGGVSEVELVGHQHGIDHGDEVEVRGWSSRGAMRAVTVRNRTTRRSLMGDGTGSTVLLVICAVFLLLILISGSG